MLIVEYHALDYQGQHVDGVHKVSQGLGKKDLPAIERDIKKQNTTLRKIDIKNIKEK